MSIIKGDEKREPALTPVLYFSNLTDEINLPFLSSES